MCTLAHVRCTHEICHIKDTGRGRGIEFIPRDGELVTQMIHDGVTDAQISFRVLEIDRVDLVRHGGRTNLDQGRHKNTISDRRRSRKCTWKAPLSKKKKRERERKRSMEAIWKRTPARGIPVPSLVKPWLGFGHESWQSGTKLPSKKNTLRA